MQARKYNGAWFADTEVYPNYTLALFKRYKKGEKGSEPEWKSFEIRDDALDESHLLQAFIDTNPCIIGWNLKGYDNFILSYWRDLAGDVSGAEISNRLYEISQYIISRERIHWSVKKYANGGARFAFIDMMEVLRKGYEVKPLKLVGVALRHRRIQDLPYPFDTALTEEQMGNVKDYCHNDVDITEKIFMACSGLVEMRIKLGQELGLELMTEADSGMVNKIFDSLYKKEANLTDEEFMALSKMRTFRRYDMPMKGMVLNDAISYKTDALKSFYEYILTKSIVYEGEKQGKGDAVPYYSLGVLDNPWCVAGDKDMANRCVGYTLDIFGNTFTLGMGGIHTKDPAGIFKSDDRYAIVDIDVEAYYPMRMLMDGICPAHLNPNIFLKVLGGVVDTRVDAKSKRKLAIKWVVLNDGLKIVINGTYGKTGFAGYWLYDVLGMYQVTMRNQLEILRLCEMLHEDGHSIISANTDGVTVRILRERMEDFRACYKAWEELTSIGTRNGKGFKMEESHYKVVARLNVNNYMVIKEGGKGEYKVKGKYFDLDRYKLPIEPGSLMKGYEFPIITKALYSYFADDKPVRHTIMEAIERNDVLDFCIANKIGKEFYNVRRVVDVMTVTHSPKTGKPYVKPKYEKKVLMDTPMQDTVRYYISKALLSDGRTRRGYELVKVSRKDGKELSHQKDRFVGIVNDYDENVDYRKWIEPFYYIDLAERLVFNMESGISDEEDD